MEVHAGMVRPVVKLLSWIILSVSLVAPRAAEPVPDFQLLDHNPNSPRFGRSVTPRDYLLQVSGYYFGDAG
jgi:hypothetical protein